VTLDKRSKLDLELFVLALVQRGINTPYDLFATVGLWPGATIPVLERLQKAGHVRRGKPGVRGRTEYEVTVSGNQHLRLGWRPLLEAFLPVDIEAIVRVAIVAVLSGAGKEEVVAYLERAAAMQGKKSRRLKREAKVTEAALSPTGDADLYQWMRTAHMAVRLSAEAKVLRQFAAALRRRSR
jgi:DNA-binding PadR family transcriptional regulator